MGLPYLRLRCPRKGRCSRRIATQRIWSRRTPKSPCTPCNATRRIWRETHLRHSSQDIPEHHLSTATELRLPPSLFDRQKSIRFICTPSSSVFETLILSDNKQNIRRFASAAIMGAARRQESLFRRFQQNTTKRYHDNHEHGGDADDFVNQVAREPGVIIIIAGDTAG